jgi:hypothetical protein
VEYHWHGIWLLTGNAYILGGIALMLLLGGIAWRLRKNAPAATGADAEAIPDTVAST